MGYSGTRKTSVSNLRPLYRYHWSKPVSVHQKEEENGKSIRKTSKIKWHWRGRVFLGQNLKWFDSFIVDACFHGPENSNQPSNLILHWVLGKDSRMTSGTCILKTKRSLSVLEVRCLLWILLHLCDSVLNPWNHVQWVLPGVHPEDRNIPLSIIGCSPQIKFI